MRLVFVTHIVWFVSNRFCRRFFDNYWPIGTYLSSGNRGWRIVCIICRTSAIQHWVCFIQGGVLRCTMHVYRFVLLVVNSCISVGLEDFSMEWISMPWRRCAQVTVGLWNLSFVGDSVSRNRMLYGRLMLRRMWPSLRSFPLVLTGGSTMRCDVLTKPEVISHKLILLIRRLWSGCCGTRSWRRLVIHLRFA